MSTLGDNPGHSDDKYLIGSIELIAWVSNLSIRTPIGTRRGYKIFGYKSEPGAVKVINNESELFTGTDSQTDRQGGVRGARNVTARILNVSQKW